MISIAAHVYQIAVEERLKDELSIRNWWATTGRALGWTDNPATHDMLIEHRARLRLLLSIAKSVKEASR